MRGIVHTLSRLPSARVLIAGAAILAGAFTSAAHGQSSGSGNGKGTTPSDSPRGDEAALVVPHFASGAEVALPRPLSAQDAAVMQRVFDAQTHGDIPEAIRSCSDLTNPLLLGNALADRYLGRYHRSSVAELTAWLARYPDLPDAPAIHALLSTRLPKGAGIPPAPQISLLPKYTYQGPATEPDGLERDPVLDRTVLDRAAHGATTLALRQLAARKGLPQAYARQLRAEIAQQLFSRNEDAAALNLVESIVRDAPAGNPPALAFYIGGLASWRLGRFDVARTMFESGADAAQASPRIRAAAAFWASRAARPLLDAADTVKWLNVAAAEKLTFHGLLARRILRLDTEIIPLNQTIGQADIDAVGAVPGGRRAFALLQIGQNERAERELRGLWTMARNDPVFGRSLMMVASFTGMADLAAQMADLLQDQDNEAALPHLPVPRLRPAGGFRLDPPLVYALARIESNFDPGAVSAAGARGLMQIMPETAQFITGNVTLSAAQLHEPASNLAIGQRYLASLATIDGIGDDLIRILASYNAGPGNVLHWLPAMQDQDDPLLFIETIPVAETRAFVPAALTYAWLYAAQMHLPSPSLDAMAAGEFPRFTPENQESRMAAALN